MAELHRKGLAICLAFVALTSCGPETPPRDGSIYSHLGSDFELTDHRGDSFRLSEQPGASLLFFGFTS